MTNAEIAEVFERIALILDLKGGENPFRMRAYARAAEALRNLAVSLRTLYEDGGRAALEELPGIGRDLALKIEELLQTGKLKYLRELEQGVPKGLLQILEIEGMGPKRTKFLWQNFHIQSISDLKKLVRSGKLASLKGWGEKSTSNILRGIEMHGRMAGRLPIGEALPLAEEILHALRSSRLCSKVELAGSLRRHRETIGDIDILATSKKPESVMDLFCSMPQVSRVLAKGSTKSSVFLKAGVDADLRVVPSSVFGAALHYFTGSKDHNVRIRTAAMRKGITISEYGVFRGTATKKGKLLAAETEEEVYSAVGLPFIPPELREDRGEIEAALKGKLPKLIAESDLRGDLHLHTSFSDGAATIAEMAEAAKARGMAYIAVTDHASPLGMVRGVKPGNLTHYLRTIEEARRRVKGIAILAGSEVDILEDGRLYLPDDALRELDFVVIAIHQSFRQSRAEVTRRVLHAIKNPFVHVLGHPLARILGKREGVDLDIEAVLKEAHARHIAIELNASPERLDLPDTHLLRAKELHVRVSIGSDAHAPEGLLYYYGIAQARRGWLEKEDVLNTLPWPAFEKFLKERRAHVARG